MSDNNYNFFQKNSTIEHEGLSKRQMKNITVTILGFILNFLVMVSRAKNATDWYFDPVMYNYDAFIWLLTCLTGAAIAIALIPDLSGNGTFDHRNEL